MAAVAKNGEVTPMRRRRGTALSRRRPKVGLSPARAVGVQLKGLLRSNRSSAGSGAACVERAAGKKAAPII